MVDILKVAKESVEVFGPRSQMVFALSKLADVNVELFNLFLEKADTEKFISAYADLKFALLQVEVILNNSTDGMFARDVELMTNFKAEREMQRLTVVKNNIKAQTTNVVKGDVVSEVPDQ
jgi:hypothetical protein